MVSVFWRSILMIIVILTMMQSFAQTQPTTSPPQNIPPPPSTGGGADNSNASQMSVSQFEKWLQSNGYAQNNAQAPTSQSAPTSTAPIQNNNLPPTSIPPPKPSGPLSYEQGQQVMLNTVPTSSPKANQEHNEAFEEMLRQNMPLTPEQVVRLRQQIDIAQRAASIPANIPPKPVSSTLMINLAPGTTPPAIRLSQGYVSALVFVDSTGQPWPIAAFDIGNPKAVSIQWDNKSNILLIQAIIPYSDGDIVVRLVGLPTPVTLQLVSGQRVVDYRVDIHVPGIGPNTTDLPMGTSLPQSASQLLLGILDGVAPPGSKLLSVIGGDCQGWLLGERIYLRTRMTLLSPGWISHMSSPDGMQAYEIPKTSTILVSRFGEPAEVRIEGL